MVQEESIVLGGKRIDKYLHGNCKKVTISYRDRTSNTGRKRNAAEVISDGYWLGTCEYWHLLSVMIEFGILEIVQRKLQ